MRITTTTLWAVLPISFVLACHITTLADELGDAIAEADRLDPGWRLEEIMARHKSSRPSNSRNSVFQAQRALKLLPKDWPKKQSGDDRPLGAGEVPRGYRLQDAIWKLEPTQHLSANLEADVIARKHLGAQTPTVIFSVDTRAIKEWAWLWR